MGSPNAIREAVISVLAEAKITARRYLDLGCGSGDFTLKIAKIIRAKEIAGLDISEYALREARKKKLRHSFVT